MVIAEFQYEHEPTAPTASFEAVLVDIPPGVLDFSVPPCPPGGEGAPATESIGYPVWDNLPPLPPICPPPDDNGLSEEAVYQSVLADLSKEIDLAARLKEQGWTVNTILRDEVYAHWNAAWYGHRDISLLEISFTKGTDDYWDMSLLADLCAVYDHKFEWLPVEEVPAPQWTVLLIKALKDAAA